MTLEDAVKDFLWAHDQFEMFAGYKITYFSDRDEAADREQDKAIGVLRGLVKTLEEKKP